MMQPTRNEGKTLSGTVDLETRHQSDETLIKTVSPISSHSEGGETSDEEASETVPLVSEAGGTHQAERFPTGTSSRKSDAWKGDVSCGYSNHGTATSTIGPVPNRLLRTRTRSSGEYDTVELTIGGEDNTEINGARWRGVTGQPPTPSMPSPLRWCVGDRRGHNILRKTALVMSVMARILLWSSFAAMIAGVVWYSLELKNNGTDTHLIAWFSAGAFVIMGFPISIYGVLMHLTHYYQPHIQCYIVRILWMVPIYSIESWLCLRFHDLAIYIETARDCYEAYVLYSFLYFLISVLGGETELTLALKDKSPTRGIHLRPLDCCVKPWLMGQPVMRQGGQVQWTSPFFIKCKFGVLQYVLLKLFTAIVTMLLELNGLYKEGDFSPRGGYLYICIITNTSQCWALYCLAFFYYATKNELAPIRPVGKFLSVKALVFFTWWQSLGIWILSYYDMIPRYEQGVFELSEEDVAKVIQDYLICIEMFIAAIVHFFVFPHTEFSENKDAALTSRRQRKRHPRMGRLNKLTRHRHMESVALIAGVGTKGSDSSSLEETGSMVTKSQELSTVENPNAPGDSLRSKNMDDDASTVQSYNSSNATEASHGTESKRSTHGFVRAFLDSAVPRDVMDHSAGILKGDYIVQKKTLLHHAATSDDYDLFVSSNKGGFVPKTRISSHQQPRKVNDSSNPNQQRRRRQPDREKIDAADKVLSSTAVSTDAKDGKRKKNSFTNMLFAGLNSSANAVSIVPNIHR